MLQKDWVEYFCSISFVLRKTSFYFCFNNLGYYLAAGSIFSEATSAA